MYDIKNKINFEYEKRVKEVEEEALNKIKLYNLEKQALTEKTQFLIENPPIPQYVQPKTYTLQSSFDKPTYYATEVIQSPTRKTIYQSAFSQPSLSAKGPNTFKAVSQTPVKPRKVYQYEPYQQPVQD